MQAEATIEPSRLTIDYPDKELNRLTTFFRLFVAIPIMIVLGTVAGGVWEWNYDNGARSSSSRGRSALLRPTVDDPVPTRSSGFTSNSTTRT